MPKYSYQFVVQRGPRPGEIFSLNQSMMILGRDPMSDIVVNDPEISRNHARLTYTDDGYEIQDMGSTNGTYVNGRRLRGEPMLLQPDVEVILGSNVTMSYEVHAVESELLETVLSKSDIDGDTPADGAGTILAAGEGEAYLDDANAMSLEEFEAEAFPPAPTPPPPTIEERPAAFEPAFYEPTPQAAVPRPMTAEPPPTPIPNGVNDGETSKKRRNYILIGAGVGVFLCCCLLGLIVLVAYIAQTQGILQEFLASTPSDTIVHAGSLL